MFFLAAAHPDGATTRPCADESSHSTVGWALAHHHLRGRLQKRAWERWAKAHPRLHETDGSGYEVGNIHKLLAFRRDLRLSVAKGERWAKAHPTVFSQLHPDAPVGCLAAPAGCAFFSHCFRLRSTWETRSIKPHEHGRETAARRLFTGVNTNHAAVSD
jgi:hypothetical protein